MGDRLKPLAGVRFLDLCEFADNLCVSLARELGALVIRRSLNYLSNPVNIGRLQAAVRDVDVLVEDRGPGFLASCGLSHRQTKCINPSLIVVSISSFGLTGPRSAWKADTSTLAALSGQTALSGFEDGRPRALWGGTVVGSAPLFALFAVMLRLLGRNTKSGGGHIDISLLECASAVTDRALVDTLNGLSVYPNRTDTDYSGDFKYIRGLDGWILAYLGRYRDRVAEWLESEYPAGAQGLRAGSDRIQGLGEGIPYIDEWVGKTSVADVFKKSQALRLPWASVESNTSLTRNPQHRARGFGRNRRVPWKSFYARPLVASGNARDSKKERAGPLSGLRVLDFSWVLAGPYASRMLADAGADIIKVQTRAVAGTLEDTATPYFRTWNRGKRGITLDLSQPGGVNLARSLIEQCDAVIESFSPRVMANWGIKPVEVCRKHPGLVWLSMSSFGATGPWRDYVSFAQTTQALSGLSAMNMDQKGRPRGVVFSFADHISGILGTIAILGALLEKQRTGHGQWIDFSQFEAISLMMGNVTKGRLERAGEKIHHYCRCAGNNRWCVITLDNLRQQESFYNLLGNKEGAKNNLRPHRMSGLMQAVWSDGQLSDLTSRLDAQKLAGELQKLGIAAGAVQDASDMLLDRQLIARGCFPFKHGKVIDNLPSGLFGHNDIDYRPAPVLGQDNFAVFRELLGMQDEEIQSYIDSRVIG